MKIKYFFIIIIALAIISTIYIYSNFSNRNDKVSNYLPLLMDFEDAYYRPILTIFKEKKSGFENGHRFRSGETPTFLLVANDSIKRNFWKFQLEEITLGECPLPCTVTGDRKKASEADAIVFFLRRMKDDKMMKELVPNRDPEQPWVMLSFEAALLANSLYKTDYKKFNGLFNRTMMQRTDADVFTPHGFIVKHSDAQLLPPSSVRLLNTTVASSSGTNSRRLVVAFTSNCKPRSGRDRYIKSMQEHSTEIDVYGKCGSLKCGNSRYVAKGYRTDLEDCFQMAGRSYLFFLAFENSFCKDYVTEKPYNLIYYPLVPIVLGSAEYHQIFPPHSYINAAHYTPKQLVHYLDYLKLNPQEYRKYFEWRTYFRTSTIGSRRSMCHLCARLYDPSFYEYKVYDDFYDWFQIQSNCSWTWKPGEGVTQVIK